MEEWVGSKTHGYGVYTWPNSSKYEGKYNYDRRYGNGQLTYEDGSIYRGNWSHDQKHGIRKFILTD